ncbi:uncharacterized protein A4U43_C02F20950 [Asparagus officinalis]|uniref:BPL/LPL catalytic domain-containing protein n=1 Tax=Asparagus officinalis TaxID=4686 RepID=A0A5P1FLN9_ASPOF|nr:biotin--protein ligase 2-like [Asparagus officinalis]XP_020254825.1 biotin--protein ligase 2-like [Asparagus officinalis]XP_020254826.1 biotin--protein ligase 2-like [Asparagus officinalis]XP_020254827.1 biotin--protein ligase 2-like [Asparagus officinalis]ONK78643.1 uncharacterized protein A4U43_C02F20950 [Asparagus officinalis]
MLFGRPKLHSVGVIVAVAAAAATVRFLWLRLPRSLSRKSFSTRNPPSSCGSTTGSSMPTLLVLCGKYLEENELAHSLKSKWMTLKNFGQEENEEVRVLLCSEMDSSHQLNFQIQLYMKALSASNFGRFLIWSPRISSTQDLVSQKFCDIPIGSACVADVQFKGRGRVKNVWDSPVGCLLFSFSLQMEDGRKLPLLQYVACLAMTEAIKEACHAKGLPELEVRIKWPNDLYLNGLKVGGILCTSTYRSKKFDVCVGIGLNVDNEKPTTCLNVALQELSSVSHQLTREDILAAFFNKFEEFFEVFLNKGFQDLEEMYYRTWLHSGQKVVIEEKHDGQSADVSVTVQGLTSSGYLLATDEDNKSYELHPDGNSFDFFKGLVRRKLG